MRSPALLLALLIGCTPAGGLDDDDTAPLDDDDTAVADDDDTADDDDDTGDDDDSTSDPGAPEYAEDEAWFALRPGDAWTYVETVQAVPDPVVDDLLVTVERRLLAQELDPGWSIELTALEVTVDRLFGATDQTHWLGLDGTGVVIWLGSELRSDFETEFIPGNGAVILERAATVDELADRTFAAAWFVADEGSTDLDTRATGLAPYLYDAGPQDGVECLETQVLRDGQPAGFQYFQPGWGLLGSDIEIAGSGVTWEITACGPCPPEAGLPQP